jgi:enoyl-CoA hydratase
MSDEAEVLFEQRGAAGIVTFNRPKALNALTHNMVLLIHAQLKAWAKDDAVKTIVVQGSGERAFCAGGDIRALYESGKAGTPYALTFYHDEYILNSYVKHYPNPYVSLIRGIDMGGGVGLSVHGPYRVADETMLFAMPETGIGLFPDVGGSYFLSRLPGETGMYLALTGARVKTADCVYLGVATHFVPAAKREALVEKLSGGDVPEAAIAALAEDAGTAPLAVHRERIDAAFSAPSVEGVLERLDRDGSDWARETAATIRTKSPTSLKVTYRQVREGKKLGFDECMRMEYRMVNRIMAGHDFYEGVRATIIDKDGAPKWAPTELAGVSDADVAAYFAPLAEKELKLA